MWGHVLFWSFLLTTVTYLVVGVVWAVCLRKWSSLLVPLGYLGYAEFTVLTTDAIASEYTLKPFPFPYCLVQFTIESRNAP